ncbi:hypothetical protein BpsM61_00044 [Bacillus phage vB_BpsM-61]|nr:hypothetical protein BpsM61_00044 [Bacillus phage vB_BpsM-61]
MDRENSRAEQKNHKVSVFMLVAGLFVSMLNLL